VNESWGIKEAAAFLRIHPDTLAERARVGEIPGCKVGRAWVFMPELLADYLRTKSTATKAPPGRGSASASLAERLAAKRAQIIAGKQTSTKRKSKDK
jgi:excisionase family DNA binding protein